jgi:hypothetical protein
MERWRPAFGDDSKTCGEAIRHANECDSDLSEAFVTITGDRHGFISARKLSH